MLTEPSNGTPLFLDKSSRISKPPEMAPGTAHFCREFFSLLKEKDWPRFAGELQRERGEKADAGICFPESNDPQGNLKLHSQVFLSMDCDFSWKGRSVDTL